MSNPYQSLPASAFWRTAVADRSLFDIAELWDPKEDINQKQKIVTFGSCFAQHIGRAFAERDYNWSNFELPLIGLGQESSRKFNYGIFSARTGNIYTTSLLHQWTKMSMGLIEAPDEVWEADGRYYDPLRPTIEPNGFCSYEEMRASREFTLSCFRQCIENADIFVFTLGLTESWFNAEMDFEYPMCPGTVAGEFDSSVHEFKNQNFHEISSNLEAAMDLMKTINPHIRFILTVSPVPLTATNSGRHVAVATMASKSILRAVADYIVGASEKVDYFPSYEIINSPIFRGVFFEPNQRQVNPNGVNFVMNQFFSCLHGKFGAPEASGVRQTSEPGALDEDADEPVERVDNSSRSMDEKCDEELLEAFGR